MRPRPIDLPAPAVGTFSAQQLRFASAAWPLRAAEELRSALIFRALARAARAASFPEPWPVRFAEAVHDEVRHAHICAHVGARLGAPPSSYDVAPVRARLARLVDPWRRAGSLLLVEVAIGETISMLLFRAGRRDASEPLTRAALSAILADEARHQRLGWSALVASWPTLSDAQRETLQHEASSGLAACERQTAVPALRWLEENRPFDPALSALGVLHPEARVEAFYAAVERLVVPRLTRLGLDGARAWSERYRVESAAPS
jgi:hypothetical protein